MNKSASIQKARRIDKDFVRLCKKHGLKKSVMIFPFGKNCIASGYIKGASEEEQSRLASLSSKLFSFTAVESGAIAGAIRIIESGYSRRGAEAGLEKMMADREKKLSKKDKAKLNKLRKRKEALVRKGEFEKASKVRLEERKLLGVEVYDVTKFDHDDLDMILDIDKAGEIILQSIKNFGKKK